MRHSGVKTSLIFAVFLLFLFCRALIATAEQDALPGVPFVGRISIKGNKAIKDDELLQVINTAEPTSFLGLGLFGSKPRPFSSDSFQKDIALIKKLYSYKGYFAAEIDTSIVRE
ncbi:MAG: outer membrane protein assembly factor, partial [Chlorobiaceae bacterium]|nr:outer membrane protein assembly factor [Chlorobiaceae bacterium]